MVSPPVTILAAKPRVGAPSASAKSGACQRCSSAGGIAGRSLGPLLWRPVKWGEPVTNFLGGSDSVQASYAQRGSFWTGRGDLNIKCKFVEVSLQDKGRKQRRRSPDWAWRGGRASLFGKSLRGDTGRRGHCWRPSSCHDNTILRTGTTLLDQASTSDHHFSYACSSQDGVERLRKPYLLQPDATLPPPSIGWEHCNRPAAVTSSAGDHEGIRPGISKFCNGSSPCLKQRRGEPGSKLGSVGSRLDSLRGAWALFPQWAGRILSSILTAAAIVAAGLMLPRIAHAQVEPAAWAAAWEVSGSSMVSAFERLKNEARYHVENDDVEENSITQPTGRNTLAKDILSGSKQQYFGPAQNKRAPLDLAPTILLLFWRAHGGGLVLSRPYKEMDV